MKLHESEVCVICGVREAETRDHIPPKNLFPRPRPRPSDLLTVPAYLRCNNGDSEEDEHFRTYLSLQIGHESDITKKLWEGGAKRSLMRRTATRKKLLESVTPLSIGSGSDVEERLAFAVPIRVYDVVFTRVTKGLYFHHTGKILGADIKISISPLYSIADKSVIYIRDLPTYSFGDGAFIYKSGIVSDDDRYSGWIYQFYDLHWILVETEPENA